MKILVTDQIADEAIEILRKEHEVVLGNPQDVKEQIKDCHALIVRSATKATSEVIEAGTELKVIGRAGVGVDNIDLDYAKSKGITVVNSPTAGSVSVAELAMAHMLGISRYLQKADTSMKSGKWEKKSFKGAELYGKKLGLLGSGRIGFEVAKRAQAFGMEVLTCDPYVSKEMAAEHACTPITIEPLLKESDYLSIHSALTDETRGMIGYEQLCMMKPTAFIINCARGPIIDQKGLKRALDEGKIAGAALDVFEEEPPGDDPIFQSEKLTCTPHIGAATKEAQIRAGTDIADQVMKVLDGKEPEFRVV